MEFFLLRPKELTTLLEKGTFFSSTRMEEGYIKRSSSCAVASPPIALGERGGTATLRVA